MLRIGLSHDPHERFPDMEALLAELDWVRQSSPPSSPPRDEPEDYDPPRDDPESDEHELMPLGELLGETDEPAQMLLGSPPDEPELTLVGGGPAPAKARRGTFAGFLVLFGTVCMMLGVVGRDVSRFHTRARRSRCRRCRRAHWGTMLRGRVSISIPGSLPCACSSVRKIVDASEHWDLVYASRWNAITNTDAEKLTDRELNAAMLAADTMIVVETFRDQAAQLARQPETRSEAGSLLRPACSGSWRSSERGRWTH